MTTICLNELQRKLQIAGLEEAVAYSMILVQDKYMFNLGIQDQLHFPKEDYAEFGYGLNGLKDELGSATYDPFLLEKIIFEKCNVSAENAALFTKVETEYMVELGLM